MIELATKLIKMNYSERYLPNDLSYLWNVHTNYTTKRRIVLKYWWEEEYGFRPC